MARRGDGISLRGRTWGGVLNRLRIDQLRAEGLSWREVARRMELPASTVYRYRGLRQSKVSETRSVG